MAALIASGAALDGGVGRGEAAIGEALLGVGTDGSGVGFTGVHLDHRRGAICIGMRLGRGGDFDGRPLEAAARVAFADAFAFAEGPLVEEIDQNVGSQNTNREKDHQRHFLFTAHAQNCNGILRANQRYEGGPSEVLSALSESC